VDAGTHLAAIVRILEPYLPKDKEVSIPYTITDGPFTGLQLPHMSAKANAAHVIRSLIDTYLITHPHLDHISGFVVNTAGLPGTRPKRIAALPSTITAFKNHIFNNVIWPNLSDENDGAGLVTYMRLVEGGSPAIGSGEGKGYMEVCEGLSVKSWSVSHGHCMENHWHRGSIDQPYSHDLAGASSAQMQRSCSNSLSSAGLSHPSPRYYSHAPTQESVCVYNSSAYFIRDVLTGREVLIFGDVEPDSISLSPRNLQVWCDAAPKIVAGNLKAIFIECSYDDSQPDDYLFGHLCPRHLIDELISLARQVAISRITREAALTRQSSPALSEARKRKWGSHQQLPGSGLGSGTSTPATQTAKDNHTNTASTASTTLHREVTPELSPLNSTMRPNSARRQESASSVSPHTQPRLLHNPPLGPLQLEAFDLDDRDRAPLRIRRGQNGSNLTDERDLEPMSAPLPSTEQAAYETMRMRRMSTVGMLANVKVVIIHVKDHLKDGPPPEESILREMWAHEEVAELGCEFVVARSGMSVWL
jgi:cAMP phosphodiesterase